MSRKIFVSCFEASGDAMGALLIKALKRQFGADCRFEGIAGPMMQTEGVKSWLPWESLNIMGIFGILRAVPRLLQQISLLAKRIDEGKFDALITIDAPDFHIRLIEKLHRHDGLRAQLVSPSVWAWRTGRAARFSRVFDAIYCILPFEPEYYANLPVRARYIGHPSLTMLAQETIGYEEFYARFGTGRIVTLLPGSRIGELQRLREDFCALKYRLEEQSAEPITWIVPILEQHRATVQGWFEDDVNPVHILTDPAWRFAAMHFSRAALCCMGTVELELSLRQCPHLALYRFKAFDFLLKRLFRFQISHGALSNILAGEEVIPEYLQGTIDYKRMVKTLLRLLEDTSERQGQIEAMHAITAKLASPECDFAVALSEDVCRLMQERSQS